jgi:ubiquinone biosynthesis protein
VAETDVEAAPLAEDPAGHLAPPSARSARERAHAGALGGLARVLPHRHARPEDGPLAQRLRLALEDLGPIFVKFGQLLSTRRDLLPEDLADELSLLQDQVPPFPAAEARAIIERSLGKPVGSLFASFEEAPLASASVAQVHAATLHSGRTVVVKVIRPRIERTIREDIGLLFTLAGWIERFHPDGWRLRPREVVRDYQHVVLDELDLQREAANTSQLRRNFLDSELLYVPEVFWDFTRREVCVMERIHGIPISDVAKLRAHGTDLKEAGRARREDLLHPGVPRQLLSRRHAPGKHLHRRGRPREAALYRHRLRHHGQPQRFRPVLPRAQPAGDVPAPVSRGRRAAHRVRLGSAAHARARVRGRDPLGVRADLREAARPDLLRPAGRLPVPDGAPLRHGGAALAGAARKDAAAHRGSGRQLYPELDLWATAKPFLEQWVADRYSPRALLEKLQRSAPAWIEQLPQRPELLRERLESLLHGAPARAPVASQPPRGGVRWRAWELAIAVIGMILVNRHGRRRSARLASGHMGLRGAGRARAAGAARARLRRRVP